MSAPRMGVTNAYSSSVLIGNWSEDQSLHSLKIAEFLHRKANHQLLIQHVDTQQKDALQEVGLSFSPDGHLHYGDHLMLYSASTQGVLSCDPSDRANGGERSFAVTTSTLTKAHVARNTFVIEPYQSREVGVKGLRLGDLLHYGDLFRLRVNPRLCGGAPFYLHSQPIGGVSSSRVSRKQEVCMSANGSTFDTVWKVAAQNPSRRFQLEHTPVPTSTPLLLIHAATAQALSSSPLRYLNDFGSEYEVCAHTHTHTAKNQGLQAERLGLKVGEEVARREAIDNHWALLSAGSRERELLLARDEEEVVRLITAMLAGVRQTVMGGGVAQLQRLSLDLWKADAERNDCLPYATFLSLLSPLLPTLRAGDGELLCNHFDQANDGSVDYAGFLTSVRGPMGGGRRAEVLRVYREMDRTGEDVVRVRDMEEAWQGEGGSISGWWRECEAVVGGVSSERFVDFYASESAFIESDDYFSHVLSSSWRRAS